MNAAILLELLFSWVSSLRQGRLSGFLAVFSAFLSAFVWANAFASAAPSVGAEEPSAIPKPIPADRYAALIEKSPFAVSTAAPEPAAPTESFAANWKVSGLSKSRAVDGTTIYTVFIQSRDLTTRFVLSGDLPNGDGVAIASVEEGQKPTQAVVTLRKGSETAKVEFDQATVSASVAAPAGGPGVPPNAAQARPPGASAPTGSTSKVPAVRPSAIPRPSTNPSAIPRPSGVPGAAPNQVPGGSSRRVRTVEEPK